MLLLMSSARVVTHFFEHLVFNRPEGLKFLAGQMISACIRDNFAIFIAVIISLEGSHSAKPKSGGVTFARLAQHAHHFARTEFFVTVFLLGYM